MKKKTRSTSKELSVQSNVGEVVHWTSGDIDYVGTILEWDGGITRELVLIQLLDGRYVDVCVSGKTGELVFESTRETNAEWEELEIGWDELNET